MRRKGISSSICKLLVRQNGDNKKEKRQNINSSHQTFPVNRIRNQNNLLSWATCVNDAKQVRSIFICYQNPKNQDTLNFIPEEHLLVTYSTNKLSTAGTFTWTCRRKDNLCIKSTKWSKLDNGKLTGIRSMCMTDSWYDLFILLDRKRIISLDKYRSKQRL